MDEKELPQFDGLPIFKLLATVLTKFWSTETKTDQIIKIAWKELF